MHWKRLVRDAVAGFFKSLVLVVFPLLGILIHNDADADRFVRSSPRAPSEPAEGSTRPEIRVSSVDSTMEAASTDTPLQPDDLTVGTSVERAILSPST